MRRKIFNIVSGVDTNWQTIAYNTVMFVAIIAGILPLMFRAQHTGFDTLEIFACTIYIIDYVAKWITADYNSKAKSGVKAFLRYPLTPSALFDLITILPIFQLFNRGVVSLRVVRLIKIARVFRLFKNSSHFSLIVDVIRSEAKILYNVLWLCLAYIFITALIMFNAEETIYDFLDALYWATTALTTVGYGDIIPVNDAGKVISMISSLVGLAIVALPSGVITARYLTELSKRRASKTEEE